MSECPDRDIVYGVTPLELRFWGVHPRLYIREETIPELKERIGRAPWSAYWERMLPLAEKGRLPEAAFAWKLTGDRQYLERAVKSLEKMAGGDTQGSHWEQWHTVAIGYDWLYADLPDPLRRKVRKVLEENGRAIYRELALHETYWAGCYVNNIAMYTFLQAALPGLALYGDVEGTASWVRWILDKMRVVTAALGPDGVSAEGISYGSFFLTSFMNVAVPVRELLGWNPFEDNLYMRNLYRFYLYSHIPHRHFQARQVHLHFGDSVRWHWYGPSPSLHYLAAAYREPHAQWIANLEAGPEISPPESALFDFLWHDPSVPEEFPDRLCPDGYFEDKGLVYLRSGWEGEGSVMGFLCGAHAGWHALEHYPQCIAGGHMSPAAGNLQLFAHGDWLLNHGAYARKWSAYHNVALIDGKGQTGEGGEWFECRRLRLEKRGPRIRRFESHAEWAAVSAEIAPAYDPELGLRRWNRHLLMIRPDVWIIADDLEADHSARFDILFHSWGEEFETDRPFDSKGVGAWETGGKRGQLRITLLSQEGVEGVAEIQFQHGIGAHRDRSMNLLRFSNPQPSPRLECRVLLEAFPAGAAPRVTSARWEGGEATIEIGGRRWRWRPGGVPV